MRAWILTLLALALVTGQARADDEATWANKLDYTLNESRDRPIVCKQGDLERFPGRSLAQVFGDAWPLQPEPEADSERVRAQMTQFVNSVKNKKGMPAQPGLVVYAVLVDASGKPLQAEVICATTGGYDKVAKRSAMQSAYRPAVINGQPVTSVFVHVMTFGGGRS
ncbi:MAG: hypothetical protein J0L89_10005 [Xanthomonadales bacterium]|nr:hypothetical protein [Xanthomonadaceae bacterium]MBN8225135.1 hypothetical protein [Xanthomonadales bacterium]MCA0196870.1 hypothetical protein [Pseudomonadota bacterium]HRF83670.1 hypothetical protein [Pseudoxanthomonas sp.]